MTLSRDLKLMLDLELVQLQDGFLEPNMELMGQFQR